MEKLLKPLDAALLLGLSQSSLAVMRCNGGGPAFLKLGDKDKSPVRYRESDIEAWIKRGGK